MSKVISHSISPSAQIRPPVVAVLGHVDHGKTSLLDAIAKTNVAAREHGGITQSIGAFMVDCSKLLVHGKEKHETTNNEPITNSYITFIDTPGHEAFAKMRARGANASDLVILVVAANDGVMPQTKESLAHITVAKLPYIVALTKSDLPSANLEKVKQQLIKEGVKFEDVGGDIPVVSVSSKTGKGIAELLDLILLVAQMHNVVLGPNGQFEAVIIEAERDRRRGTVATVIVRNGTLSVGDEIVAENIPGKVRALITDKGESVKKVLPGHPVAILGFSDVPLIGAAVFKKTESSSALPTATKPTEEKSLAVESIQKASETKRLVLLIKTDTQGSLEAVLQSLPKEEVKVILAASGQITEADVLLAKASNGIIVGFNTHPSPSVAKLAEVEGVLIKTYKIIYELLDELKEVLEISKEGKPQELILGRAKILAVFPYEGKKVAGCKVLEGRMAKGDKVRVEREDALLGEARIVSIRRGKEDIGKAEMPLECGILLSTPLDFDTGDVILSVR